MVEDWQATALASGSTPDHVDQAVAQCEELYPPYDLPIVRQYAQQYDAPFHADGCALVYCEMDITHLQAAQKDTRLTIFTSLDDAVDPSVVASHADLINPPQAAADAKTQTAPSVPAPDAPPPATLRELLAAISARHVKFSASE